MQDDHLAFGYSRFGMMETLHCRFFAALADLSSKDDGDFACAFPAFVAVIESIFAREQEWIDEDDQHFREHLEQHARILGALHHLHARVAAGDVAVGRYGVQILLPQWLSLHIATLDLPLAVFLQGHATQTNGHPAPHFPLPIS